MRRHSQIKATMTVQQTMIEEEEDFVVVVAVVMTKAEEGMMDRGNTMNKWLSESYDRHQILVQGA